MHGISKTLNEMTLVERVSLLENVADALEASADEAEGDGDARFVENSMCVVNTIRGLSADLGGRDLAAAELLLEQGIMMVLQFTNRKSGKIALH
ncbi:hypothetical protein HGP14_30970 [Rhizobium sp. P32RR-XVIII]|uniref:hypothetical protein n=1 Tax=Rhizobium sp. P32RR-XVIII TaxID=2726738 RepID=UPI00145787E6|nr:hypothetical protein [Rhizobium sp. P32RR-XVIII]NLS07680.1 hypothetical protein [Rhizobium sp. P32RR-XVIII]